MLYVVAASAEFLFSFVVATCCIIFLDSPNDGKHSDTPSALSEASAASLARRLRGKRKKEEREERQEEEEALRALLSYFSGVFLWFPLLSGIVFGGVTLTLSHNLAVSCFPLLSSFALA